MTGCANSVPEQSVNTLDRRSQVIYTNSISVSVARIGIMNTAEQILVVFLSTALAIFLVIAIVAGIHVIRLLRKVENIANTAESISESIRQAVDKVTMLTSLSGLFSAFRSHGKSKKHNDKEV